MPRETIEELFDELAATELPVPALVSVVARGRQRRLRGRVTMTVSSLAVVAIAGSGYAYVQHNIGRGGQPASNSATSKDRHAKPRLSAPLPAAPPPRSSPLLLSIEEVKTQNQPSWRLVMTRLGNATKLVPLRGLPPGAAAESHIATDPAGGWVISYATSQKNVGAEPERLAAVSTSGVVSPFGPVFPGQAAITSLAVRPTGSAVAVAITHVGNTYAALARPAQIELIPLPGYHGPSLTWTLASGPPLRNMVESLSWSPDGTKLTYIPGNDATGGGFASDGAVTFNLSGHIAPSVSSWPRFEKGKGQCHLETGAWQAGTGKYLALEQCGSDVRLVAVNPVTGASEGPAWIPNMPNYFGCANPTLAPAPESTLVLISGCGLMIYAGGHIGALDSPLAGVTVWAGQPSRRG